MTTALAILNDVTAEVSSPDHVTSPAEYEPRLLVAFGQPPWNGTVREIFDRGLPLLALALDQAPERVRARAHERAQEVMAIGQSLPAIRAHLELARASLQAFSSPPATITMIGILLAGYRLPSTAPNLETHMHTVAFDLVDSGYSPAIVARACQQWRRANKYPPTGSAELLQACADAQAELKGALSLGAQLERILERAEAIAALPAPVACKSSD